jgi:hypothetical protein
MCQGLQIAFMSFRASEARHGIQCFYGYRRRDCVVMSLRARVTTEAIS